MSCSRSLRFSLSAFTLALTVAAGASAQDAPADKPCEQRLRELQEQLRQSENRVKDLIRENERLRRDVSEARSGGKAPEKPKKSQTPTAPLASPAALYEALVKDYQEKVGSLPRDSQSEKVKHQGAARKWTQDAVSAFRGPVDWQIQVVKVSGGAGGRPADVTFNILDESGKPSGEPMTQAIPGRFIRDLSEGVGVKVFRLTGTFGARPKFDPAAADKQADGSTIIGPFVLFDYDLAVQSIAEAK